jgi:hypothetical protein
VACAGAHAGTLGIAGVVVVVVGCGSVGSGSGGGCCCAVVEAAAHSRVITARARHGPENNDGMKPRCRW